MSIDYKPIPSSLCKICQFNTQDTTIPDCQHQFCVLCLKEYLLIKITEGDVLAIQCPETDCPSFLSLELIETLQPDQTERYLNLKSKKQKESNPNFRWCPYTDCSGFDEKSETNRLKCNQCQMDFCYLCSEPWHEGLCNDFAIKGLKRCPMCSVIIEKNYGCLEIKCSMCGFKFCWLCGQGMGMHSLSKCVLASKGYCYYWIVAVVLMFYPVLLVFFMPAFIVFAIFSDDGVDKFKKNLILHICGFIASIFISPALMPLAAISFLAFGPIPFICRLLRSFKNKSNLKVFMLLCCLPFFYILLVFGFIFMFLLTLVVMPLMGIGLFFYKLILLCI